ncbi:MAG: PEP-CTERM sorting domain-containing protein [Luteolibacter sp.]|uniref:PEP-CTERM sorting domain-containing protein n=1 Tax=Luteolibacter sp. TaxID=1962973 RepID=UPI003265B4FA
MAEDSVKTAGLELEVESEATSEGDPAPKASGKTSASEISAYFDEIFGKFGQWLAYTLSDDRPIESGNLSSSEGFLSGDRAAFLGSQPLDKGSEPLVGIDETGNFAQPPADWNPPEGYQGPRIEIKSRINKGPNAEGAIDESLFRHSKAAIDRYFAANVLRTHKIPANGSSRSETQRSKTSMTAFNSLSASDTTTASFAIQAVPEPSSILLCGFATTMFVWCRRRPDLK